MNKPLLYIILFVLFIFGAGLIVIGSSSRDSRKLQYLEMTHRVTAGHGTESDFRTLSEMLGPEADAQTVRALFGLPDTRTTEITLQESPAKTRKGNFWVYIISNDNTSTAPGATPKDVTAFVVEFDKKGSAKGEFTRIANPTPTTDH